MAELSEHTFARWGIPPQPVVLSESAREFLAEQLGPARPSASGALGDINAGPSRLPDAAVAGLQRIVGSAAVSVAEGDRVLHSAGCSLVDYLRLRTGAAAAIPDAVVRPDDRTRVQQLLAFCSDSGIDVVPFGGGTSVVGGVTPAGVNRPWVSVALDRMDSVLAIDEISQTVTVQPGITAPALERILARRGFTLGHVPQSWERASLGGYVATRSAGQSSTGYGRSDEMVEALRVATPVGELLLGRGPRSAAGPDLRQLFIGSEGALGIITEIELRVRRSPAVTRYEGVMLPSWERGIAALRELAQTRSSADVMRLSDPDETAATLSMSGPQGIAATLFQRYARLRRVAGGCLMILGWDGWSRRAVAARRQAAWSVLRSHGAASLGASVGSSWRRHRFDGPYVRDQLLDNGYIVETVETAAQWRDIPDLYRGVGDALRNTLGRDGGRGFVMCHMSHVYETGASLYFTAFAAAAADPVAHWQEAKQAATDAVVAHGGTITHHHAVGRDHAPWLAAELGDGGIRVLTTLKAALDPQRVMNPGVLLPR